MSTRDADTDVIGAGAGADSIPVRSGADPAVGLLRIGSAFRTTVRPTPRKASHLMKMATFELQQLRRANFMRSIPI